MTTCIGNDFTINSRNNHIPSIQHSPTYAFRTAISRAPGYLSTSGTIVPLDDWYSGPKHPLIFDLATWRDDGGLTPCPWKSRVLVRQQLSIPNQRTGEDTLPSPPSATRAMIDYTCLQGLRDSINARYIPSMICEGQIVATSCHDSKYYAMATPARTEVRWRTEPPPIVNSKLVCLGGMDEDVYRQHAFDPCSGRLLRVCDRTSSLLISHYLRTPY